MANGNGILEFVVYQSAARTIRNALAAGLRGLARIGGGWRRLGREAFCHWRAPCLRDDAFLYNREVLLFECHGRLMLGFTYCSVTAIFKPQ